MRPHRRQPTRLLCPWDFPSKDTGVGCHSSIRILCIYIIEYYTAIFFTKKDEILPFVTTQMDLQGILLSEMSGGE